MREELSQRILSLPGALLIISLHHLRPLHPLDRCHDDFTSTLAHLSRSWDTSFLSSLRTVSESEKRYIPPYSLLNTSAPILM